MYNAGLNVKFYENNRTKDQGERKQTNNEMGGRFLHLFSCVRVTTRLVCVI